MTKTNTRLLFACYLLCVLISCKKPKDPVVHHFTGRLLLSSSNPTPVTFYSLEFRQEPKFAGLAGISSTFSSATTTTDAQGNFKCDFTTGETSFLGRRQGPSQSQIYLQGDRNIRFTHCLKLNITQDNLGDIFLVKKIDTLIITVDAQWGITPTDTIEIIYNTTNDNLRKRKGGLNVPAGATNVLIDTIYNVAFSTFDFETGMYMPNLAVFHRERRTTQPYDIDYRTDNTPNRLLEPGDEKKRTLNLR